MPEFRLPKSSDRVAIVGRTGSGKTTLAAWLLSNADIDRKPWIIVDYKHEQIFADIQKQEPDAVTELDVTAKAPKKPGLYVVRPIPSVDDENLEKMLWDIWERGKTGIYIDEAHLIPNTPALKASLVTGRSLKIPMIVISQRPVWVPREVFSEANHHVIFDLNRLDDRRLVGSFMDNGRAVPRLGDHRSYWHNVDQNMRYYLKPAPSADVSVSRILDRAPRHFRWY